MNAYLVQLELRSAIGTPLAADTLWGHIGEVDHRKHLDKRAWISREAWQPMRQTVSPENVETALAASAEPPAGVTTAVSHAAINRLTGDGTGSPLGTAAAAVLKHDPDEEGIETAQLGG